MARPCPCSADLIAEARALANAATPGPWEWIGGRRGEIHAPRVHEPGADCPYSEDGGCISREHRCGGIIVESDARVYGPSDADGQLMARSRMLVLELADALERAEAELRRANARHPSRA